MIAVHGSMGEGGGRYEAAAIVLPTTFRDLWKGAMEIELHWSYFSKKFSASPLDRFDPFSC